MTPDPVAGEVLSDEDWYGEDLGGPTFVDCRFVDCDLTEVTTQGASFTSCSFVGCRLNASTHRSTVFARCTFRRTSLFAAALVGCKLVGSVFDRCTLRPMTVEGGDWSFVSMVRADLGAVDLSGVRLVEADLTGANLTDAVLSRADLSRAALTDSILTRTDLGGAVLAGVDLSALRWDDTGLDAAGLMQLAADIGIRVVDG